MCTTHKNKAVFPGGRFYLGGYYEKNKLGGVVIGISGGKDSGVVAGLFTEALGKENVVGITLPCHSKETDKEDAFVVGMDMVYKQLMTELESIGVKPMLF